METQPLPYADRFKLECSSPIIWEGMIRFTVNVTFDGKPIYSGPYSVGTGHVKPQYITRAGAGFGSNRPDIAKHIIRHGLSGKWIGDGETIAKGIILEAARMQKLTPKLENVIHSLILDGTAYFDRLTFPQWCAEYGYSDDSIKAQDIFRICERTGQEIARHVTPAELDTLREWASQY